MNGLDLLFIIIVAFSVGRSLFRGFLREVASLAGVVVGFFAASRFYQQAAYLLPPQVEKITNPHLVSFIITFIAVLGIISLLGYILSLVASLTLLGWVDRFLGAALGLAKGVLICAVVAVALQAFLSPETPIISHSRLYPRLAPVVQLLADMVPDTAKASLAHNGKALKETLNQVADKAKELKFEKKE